MAIRLFSIVFIAVFVLPIATAQDRSIPLPPYEVDIYPTGNILAVGVWNSSLTSSDLLVNVELVDNNGVVYTKDSADGGWPKMTRFRYQIVYKSDGSGEEIEDWMFRENADGNTFDDSDWIESDTGFTLGYGTSGDGENAETEIPNDSTTVYIRLTFDIPDYDSVESFTLRFSADDAAVVFFNDFYIAAAGQSEDDIPDPKGDLTGLKVDPVGQNGEIPEFFAYDTIVTRYPPSEDELLSQPAEYNTRAARTIHLDAYQVVDLENLSIPLPDLQDIEIYPTGNVLALGAWNEDITSSDLVANAYLVDNNGVVYTRDSADTEGWPKDTVFRYIVPYFTTEPRGTIPHADIKEEPGWQQRDFDDSHWNENKIGFTIGYGTTATGPGGERRGEIGDTELGRDAVTVYTRSIFDIPNFETVEYFDILFEADDAGVAWFNGHYIGACGQSHISDDDDSGAQVDPFGDLSDIILEPRGTRDTASDSGAKSDSAVYDILPQDFTFDTLMSKWVPSEDELQAQPSQFNTRVTRRLRIFVTKAAAVSDWELQ